MGPQGKAPRSSAKTGLGGEQVEGRQAVRELLLANRRDAREIWLAQDLDPAPVLEDIRELAAEARVVVKEVGRGKLDAAARTDAPQGVIAFAKPLPEADLDDLIARRSGKPPPFLLCSDGITDPGNLGALLRSAECAGVTGVVLPQHRAVHITPTVAKAAAGAVEHLPMTTVGGMPTAIKTMKDAGIWVVGLDERADKTLWDLTMDDAPVALVLGAEGPGLSRLVRERCDELVSIPMRGRVASLNVGTAGTLACFEIARAAASADRRPVRRSPRTTALAPRDLMAAGRGGSGRLAGSWQPCTPVGCPSRSARGRCSPTCRSRSPLVSASASSDRTGRASRRCSGCWRASSSRRRDRS
ncbi:23S rRNA (guanosine(2251)-2'-O)-methyltransferase RlmB [Aquihabitans daechungensis]|uniref:23S rRNA (guanosine(2251)-2'-O)-methyltransferase RlmB n=1 Tax=Aquihabitans daechungensis TaxID=1052257 RepID=UPI003B9DD25D